MRWVEPKGQEGGGSQGLVQEMHLVTPPQNPYFKPLALQPLRNLSHPYWQDSLFLLPYMQPANSAASPGLLSSTGGRSSAQGQMPPVLRSTPYPDLASWTQSPKPSGLVWPPSRTPGPAGPRSRGR